MANVVEFVVIGFNKYLEIQGKVRELVIYLKKFAYFAEFLGLNFSRNFELASHSKLRNRNWKKTGIIFNCGV